MELLCIQTHSQKAVIAGNTYPLLGSSECRCGKKLVDIGLKGSNPNGTHCKFCNYSTTINTNVWWISAQLFGEIGTIDENSQYEEKKELVKVREF